MCDVLYHTAAPLSIDPRPDHAQIFLHTIGAELSLDPQCAFAVITGALISGATVGRMKFSSYVVFLALWTTLVVCSAARLAPCFVSRQVPILVHNSCLFFKTP